MEKDWMVLLQQHNQLGQVLKLNRDTEKYGLVLSEQDAMMILKERENSLREQRRIEFGEGIISKIIYEFCDSDFIDQNNYVETIIRLQEIFYLFKNEMEDEITDDELLHLMKEQYELICFGDLDYLEGTCLNIFSQAIRAGYQGYQGTEGRRDYAKFDEVQRWDYDQKYTPDMLEYGHLKKISTHLWEEKENGYRNGRTGSNRGEISRAIYGV